MTQIIADPVDIARVLNSLPPGHKIEFRKLPTGVIIVTDDAPKKSKSQLLEENYAHLKGVGITISEAADKYGVPRSIVRTWVYRTNDVGFVNEASYPRLVDEAEVALCAGIYKKRKQAGIIGIPYFDDDGFHLENIQHPDRAAKRRSRRLKQAA